MAITPEEAAARAESDMRASRLIDQLRSSTGASFAGGWIESGKAYVGVTDKALVDAVAAAGANPVLMANSLAKLEKDKEAIDHVFVPVTKPASSASSDEAREGIAAWYVDVMANKIVIEALEKSRGKAQDLASKAGVAAQDFEVRTVESMPRLVGDQKVLGSQ